MERRQVLRVAGGVIAATLPIRASGEQSAAPLIGFMSGRSAEDSVYLVDAVRHGLRETGYIEGETISIEYRWANGDYARLPELASELLNLKVDLIVAVGGDSSPIAAKRATSTLPIVFGMGSDPVKAGLTASFNRPGGNATGFTLLTNRIEAKRVGLLNELVPGASSLGALINPNFPPSVGELNDIEEGMRSIHRELVVERANSDAELDSAFAALAKRGVAGTLIAASPFFDTRRERLIGLSAQLKIPAIYQFREYAVAGGLVSYGPRIADSYKQAGVYAGQILRGAKPGDLPVVQPTRFELIINLKTASALGLSIPNAMQLLADEVIE